MVNKTQVALCEEFALYTNIVDFTLVAGQREYVIPETYKTLFSANYIQASSAQPIYLTESSVDELDNENPGWRTTFTGVPFRWYEWSNSNGNPVVGFDPIPSTSSSAGYPTIRLVVGLYVPLTATDSLPQTIRGSSVYREGLCYQWAKHRNKPDLAIRKSLWEEARDELGIFLARKERRLSPRQSPYMVFSGKAV